MLQHFELWHQVSSNHIPFIVSLPNSKPEEIRAMPLVRDDLPHLGSIVHKIEHFFAGSNCGFCQPCGTDSDVTRVELAVANDAEHLQTYSKNFSSDPEVSSAQSNLNQFRSVHGATV